MTDSRTEGGFAPPSFDIEPFVPVLDGLRWRTHRGKIPSDDYAVCSLVSRGRHTGDSGPFRALLEAFAPIREAWLAKAMPGGFVGNHVDPEPHYDRWQVPILVGGQFRQGDEVIDPEPGVPFRVTHWVPHGADNPTEGVRVHLIVERAVLAPKA